jgi:hypothetical protein
VYTGREQPHVLVRHAVRKWYRDKKYTYRMIARLELSATGYEPDHSTIIHSCRVADEQYMKMVSDKADLLNITA